MRALPRDKKGMHMLRYREDVYKRQGGETAGLDGEHFRAFPPFALPRNPDAGLLVQDGYVPWARRADDLKAYRD